MKIFLFLIFLFAFYAGAQELAGADSSAANKDSSVVEVERANPLLTVVLWPFVHIVHPAIEFMIYPVIPPLIYVSRENLIDKGINLITFGDKKQIMIYPKIGMQVGAASNISFAYKHSNLILDRDYLSFSPSLYVNADWEATFSYKKNNILNSSVYSGFRAKYGEFGNSGFKDLYGDTYSFADSSVHLNVSSGFSLIENWGLELGVSANINRFDFSNLNDIAIENTYTSNRGFYRNFEEYPLTLSLLHNSLDAQYSATRGNKFSLSYSYVPTTSYSGSKDHNYHVADGRITHYSLLGQKSYAMTVAESEINREKLKGLSLQEIIEILNPINIKEDILDRKVLVTQLKARYMVEENEGMAPFTAMSKLGGNFPLRAYTDGFFAAPLVAGVSAEYRWPIDRYADALIFNEYGIYGEDFSDLSVSGIKNSYGFGFRIRLPNMFIARFALALHGLQGITIIFTTGPEYD
jgi:hypothetical protein